MTEAKHEYERFASQGGRHASNVPTPQNDG
jgi:hypothetical protein